MSSFVSESTDAIVLAGTANALVVEQAGRPTPKPFLRLGGKPLVLSVCEALAGVQGVGRIFVVGDVARLQEALEPLLAAAPDRLEMVAEGGGVMENAVRAFFQHLVPARGLPAPPLDGGDYSLISKWLEQHPRARECAALVVTCDLPFLAPADIEDFLRRVAPRAALTMGLVDYRGLKWLAGEVGQGLSLERWKLGAVHLRGISVRMSNLFLARPLLGNPRVYPLLDDLYQSRRLLGPRGGLNLGSWLSTARSILRHAWRVNPWWRFLRGMVNFLPALGAGALARMTHRAAPWPAWPWRLLLGKKDVEFIGSLLMGAPGQLVIADNPAPAIDIDVEEIFRFLEENGQEGYRRLAALLQQRRLAEKEAAAAASHQ